MAQTTGNQCEEPSAELCQEGDPPPWDSPGSLTLRRPTHASPSSSHGLGQLALRRGLGAPEAELEAGLTFSRLCRTRIHSSSRLGESRQVVGFLRDELGGEGWERRMEKQARL